MAWSYAVISVVVVSLLSLVGIFFLAAEPARLRRILLILVIGPHVRAFSVFMLPIAAGGFIYIAGSDLIPQVQESCGGVGVTLAQFLAILLGIGLMALLVLLE